MRKTFADKVLDLTRKRGVLRAKELDAYDIPREYLSRLVRQGLLERQARGLYTLPDEPKSEHHTLAQIATRVPDAVICLLSALTFHDIATQLPAQVWIAIPRKTRRPKMDYPPLRVCMYSEAAYKAGVESHLIDGRKVNIYSASKTVVDCFKYRNKIGLDVALEAL